MWQGRYVSAPASLSTSLADEGKRRMDTSPLSITRPLTLELIDASGSATAVVADLTYDACDPYAVAAGFCVQGSALSGEAAVRWVFARSLLATGVYEPVGEGDVRIWPCLNTGGEAVTVIELLSPEGAALLQGRSDEVSAFLRETETLVPQGAEAAYLDVDDTITKLLA
jgi:Streptomyces sporulation and cell division protein, SsgA